MDLLPVSGLAANNGAFSKTWERSGSVPRELSKVASPRYLIEPPDVLVINAVRCVPRPPYRLEPMDVIGIQAAQSLPNQPIAGPYTVSPDGTINLGHSYGQVQVAGRTIEDCQVAINRHLSRVLQNPQVALSLMQFHGAQEARGEHLVRPDGTINMGSFGVVHVAGLTREQAKSAIEQHLSRWLLNPELSLKVLAYKSTLYYVVTDGPGLGEQVIRH
jgi:protein involved in polysaccharide export with SLBB domain